MISTVWSSDQWARICENSASSTAFDTAAEAEFPLEAGTFSASFSGPSFMSQVWSW
ncbi:hypothetical protein WG922_17710 [Ramlibacter sp. AN1015]|uniref:hypothetical protein n=1 Tax=Ramlibacter sp. AN1015 TaxID=3133428 RepID=UPI0030BC4ED7